MKAVVLTGLDNKNYGNRLQNYAVKKILEQNGYSVQNMYAYISPNTQKQVPQSAVQLLKRLLPKRIRYMCQRINTYNMNNPLMIKRVMKFIIYTNKYVPVKMYYAENIEDLSKKIELENADMFFVGSDQVWNPNYSGGELFFLTFAPKEKRSSFIASMGVRKIPEDSQQKYTDWLNDMKYISVREKSAANIIDNLTGKKVDCFLDPTLLVDEQEWLKIEKKPKVKLPNKYMLAFFFDETPIDAMKKLANSLECELIVLNDKKYPRYFSLSPDELLFILRNACMVLTDSFHITTLSIIFRRQFLVYKRQSFEEMFVRLENLLEELGLNRRIVNDNIAIEDVENITEKEFNVIQEIRKNQRMYLDKALQRLKNEK